MKSFILLTLLFISSAVNSQTIFVISIESIEEITYLENGRAVRLLGRYNFPVGTIQCDSDPLNSDHGIALLENGYYEHTERILFNSDHDCHFTIKKIKELLNDGLVRLTFNQNQVLDLVSATDR